MNLKSIGNAALNLRLGKRRCICLRSSSMDKELRKRIRPFALGWLSCWFERAGT